MADEVVVQRQIQQEVQAPTVYYEMPEGLPFYYYIDIGFIIMFILKLVFVAFIAAFIFGVLFLINILSKKYICVRCNHEFTRIMKPLGCPKCNGIAILKEDYEQQHNTFENGTQNNNL